MQVQCLSPLTGVKQSAAAVWQQSDVNHMHIYFSEALMQNSGPRETERVRIDQTREVAGTQCRGLIKIHRVNTPSVI